MASANYAGYRAVMMLGEEFKCFVKFDPYYQEGVVNLYCLLVPGRSRRSRREDQEKNRALVRK